MAVSKIDTRIARLDEGGLGVVRYGVVFLLVVIGATKFTAWEAARIARAAVSSCPVGV